MSKNAKKGKISPQTSKLGNQNQREEKLVTDEKCISSIKDLLELGDFKTVLSACEYAIKFTPKKVELHCYKIDALIGLNEIDKANKILAILKEIKDLSPKSDHYYFYRGCYL